MRAIAALALAVLLAGCASSEPFGFAKREQAPVDPFFAEHRDVVAGNYLKVFEVPLSLDAVTFDVVAILDTRSNGLPVPDAAPAQLTVSILGPDGQEIAKAQIDPGNPSARMTQDAVPAGLYFVQVQGTGFSHELEGGKYGASYVLGIEALFE